MENNHQELVNEVLRKIGRNVLIIQRVEGLLKFLLSRSELKGSAANLKSEANKQELKASNQTLGTLVKNYMSSVYVDTKIEDQPDTSQDGELEQALFEFKFTIKTNTDEISKRKEELREIVEARNHLIHDMLLNFDQNSSVDCDNLVDELDTQFEKLSTEHEKLRLLAKQFIEMSLDLFQEMKDSNSPD